MNARVKLVLLVAALIGVVIAFWLAFRGGPEHQPITMVTVMPLQSDTSLQDLGDTIAEETAARLGPAGIYEIVAPTSSVRLTKFRDGLVPDDLGINGVLSGTLTQNGSSFKARISLRHAQTMRVLWTAEIERSSPSELAVAIAAEAMSKAGKQSAAATPWTSSAAAYGEYAHARRLLQRETVEATREALQHLEQAVATDARFARAYAAMTDAYILLEDFGESPPLELQQKAREAARKAIEIDPRLWQGHYALGQVRFRYDWDFAAAEREYKQALDLNPNYAAAHRAYANLLAALERSAEAERELKVIRRLDPVSIGGAANLRIARRLNNNIYLLQRVLEYDPTSWRAHEELGCTYRDRRQITPAMRELQRAFDLAPVPEVQGELGYTVAGLQRERALDMIQKLRTSGGNHEYWIAYIYAGLYNPDAAIEWLQKAFANRSGRLVDLEVRPEWYPLRSDPRFAALLAKIKPGTPVPPPSPAQEVKQRNTVVKR